ncbi:MAG: hypothetical protein V3W37_03590 [Candidatus Binatia bacterium]
MPIRERSDEGGFYSIPGLDSIDLEETLIGRTLFDMSNLIGYSFKNSNSGLVYNLKKSLGDLYFEKLKKGEIAWLKRQNFLELITGKDHWSPR